MARARPQLHLLISSGSTRQPLDAVRFLSNYSTGFMGACLAREAVRRGHRVTVVSGPAAASLPVEAVVVPVERNEEMQAALRRYAPRADAVVMAAAVCDFAPRALRTGKAQRKQAWTLKLRATPDIIGTLPRRPGQVRVGFAVESRDLLARARRKLQAKRLDLIVAQPLERGGAPFGRQAVTAVLLAAGGARPRLLKRVSKPRLARAVLDEIERRCYADSPGNDAPGRTR